MTRSIASLFLFCAISLFAPLAVSAVTIQWSPVGNAGNANDPFTGSLYGSVAYTYQISKHEVTNSQYTEFLNAKAASDPLSLYNTRMNSSLMGGINRSGESGSFSYSVKSGYGNMPVVFVSWYDSLRFANWMNNGQGSADTETGAYTLLGGTPTPSNGESITRNGGANVFLTSENEWYKAAYHQPAAAGGDSDHYWVYPTATNAEPNSDQPPGDPSIQSNAGNFYRDDGLANGYNDGFAVNGANGSVSPDVNYLTDVGAYTAADSYYGTFDQGGNVWERNDTLIFGDRGIRGGSWIHEAFNQHANYRINMGESFELNSVGFRLASVPEPGTGVLAVIACGLIWWWRKRSK